MKHQWFVHVLHCEGDLLNWCDKVYTNLRTKCGLCRNRRSARLLHGVRDLVAGPARSGDAARRSATTSRISPRCA